jgi:chemotaxis protein methyltransferase WspC
MAALGIDDPERFVAIVRSDRAERDRLVEEVIVAESWFFRDRQVFAFVADFAVTLASLPGRVPVRILCAPCASGEEPYSVAMALLDAGLTPGQFVIDAIDVSYAALDRAHRGRYSANAFRNTDNSFRDRWFRVDGSGAVIDDAVRAGVRFAWANLLDDNFGADRDRYDVIFCRNLLIYLTAEARGRVEQTVNRLLRPDGILVLGAAEPPIMKGDWITAGSRSVFALRRGVPPAVAAPAMPVALAAPVPSAGVTPGIPSLEEVLRQAGDLANAGRHSEALRLCEAHQRRLGPAAELFFFMGVLHQSAGDLDRAEACFHKTLYLEASHEEALLSLALLAAQRGDAPMAEKYRQSSARVLSRKAPS